MRTAVKEVKATRKGKTLAEIEAEEGGPVKESLVGGWVGGLGGLRSGWVVDAAGLSAPLTLCSPLAAPPRAFLPCSRAPGGHGADAARR